MASTRRFKLVILCLLVVALAIMVVPGMVAADEEYEGCLYVWTHDEDGENEQTTVVVQGTESDFSELYETDEDGASGCSSVGDSNGVGFDTPGGEEFLVYVFEDSDENWGVFETAVPANDEQFLSVDRGGIFPVDGSITTDSEIYAADGEATVSVTLRNGQNSIPADGTVNLFIYPEDESRPSEPQAIIKADSVSRSTPEEFTKEITLPDSTGQYTVEARVDTSFEHSQWNSPYTHFTGDISLGTIDIVDPQPPKIESTTPSDVQFQMGETDTRKFSVSASDPNVPDSQLTTSWYVNKNRVATGDAFSFDAEDFGYGEFTIRAVVSDGREMTQDVLNRWDVTVIAAPEIDSIDVQPAQVTAGETVEFSADASSPDGEATTFQYEWAIAGETHRGGRATMKLRSVGEHEVKLKVTNEYGLTTTSTETVTVENSAPSIEVQDGLSDSLSSGDSISMGAQVTNQDLSRVDAELRMNGETVATEKIPGGTTSEVIRLSHPIETPGTYDVEVIVKDGHGASRSITGSVDVAARDPVIESVSPTGEVQDVESGDQISFEVSASDPDDGELEYEWFVDGNSVGSGQTYTHEFSSAGTSTVSVEVTNEWGTSVTNQWQVNIKSFRDPPQIEDHVSTTEVKPLSPSEFVTLSVEHPSVNERSVRTEIIASVPDGVELTGVANVDRGDGSRVKYVGEVSPGESSSMRLNLRVTDESMVGEDLSIDYKIRYYPENQPQDYIVVQNETADISVVETVTGKTGGESGSDVSSGGESGSGVPGFTGGTSLAVVVGVLSWRLLSNCRS